jgi:hypothetical protein
MFPLSYTKTSSDSSACAYKQPLEARHSALVEHGFRQAQSSHVELFGLLLIRSTWFSGISRKQSRFRNLLHPISIVERTCIPQHTFTTSSAFDRALRLPPTHECTHPSVQPLSPPHPPHILATSDLLCVSVPSNLSSSLNSQDKPRWRQDFPKCVPACSVSFQLLNEGEKTRPNDVPTGQ